MTKVKKKKKVIVREVSFDAMTMKSAADIVCRGPVLNLGDAPQAWKIWVTVRSFQPGQTEITRDQFYFSPVEKISLRGLHRVIMKNLDSRERAEGEQVTSIRVIARIL